MKTPTLALVLLSGLSSWCAAQGEWKPSEWRFLKKYDENHLYNIALPLGGIGTGTVSLGGRGELRDWELMNTPAKGFNTCLKGNDAPFFCLYAAESGKKAQGKKWIKGLLGPMDPKEYVHYDGRPVNHHGIPRFQKATFQTAYPFGQVTLSDPDMPVKVKIKGFNPLIPGDSEKSGIPIAILSYEVTNTSGKKLDIALSGNIRNFIGKDGKQYVHDWKGDTIPTGASKNINKFIKDKGFCGISFTSDGVKKEHPAWGTLALVTDSPEQVTYRTSSVGNSWSVSMVDFWDDFSADGELTEKQQLVDDDPMASLAVKATLAPGETKNINFYLTWHFPNRQSWAKAPFTNYYCTQYKDAWDVAQKTLPAVPELEKKSQTFVKALCDSDYPESVKEAALFNLSVLRSQTVFRLPSGHMMGWEGIMDVNGSCYGSCTHVWNYEQATPFLFGSLARTMRDVEFNHALHEDGAMDFRASIPLGPEKSVNVAADGQMGCIMKFYRDWQLCGDDEFLKANWPKVKKALAYAWVPKGWDGNKDGVMEGSQHNTMDVNYVGPNPQMGFWYLGALRAAEEMAKYLKDDAFARECRTLFDKGSQWMDANLFNGEYYEHKITNPGNYEEFLDMSDVTSPKLPGFQLGPGCLVDQLVGQYMAHICGLGYLAKPENIHTTLNSIMKYNFKPSFADHFCNMRSYALGDESGLIMASWPKGRLKIPFPYFAENMTGFEYTAAIGMLYEGMNKNGLKCVKAIRDRFDGNKRNPFSEQECGHHYARSMASWAAIPALSGFHYSGVDKSIRFTGKPGIYFWSNGDNWGTARVSGKKLTLEVLHGSLSLKNVGLDTKGTFTLDTPAVVKEGEKRTFTVAMK